ncbi:helix-turn-helix domain-containing protein [Paenibacillus sp. CAU 1782]
MQDESLREPMDMPDPRFPVKVHKTVCLHAGTELFPHHWHEHLEFLYIVRGEAKIECGSADFAAKAGDLIVVNSNELHHGISGCDDLFYYALISDPTLLQSSFSDTAEMRFLEPIRQSRLLLRNHISGNDEIAGCIESIVRELDEQAFGYELAVKSLLYRLLALLVRMHAPTVLSKMEHAERIKNLKRFDPVLRYIDENYHEPLTVETLSSIAGLSRFHFSRLFKEMTGRTLSAYILSFRLNRADYLLRHTELTVSEIAALTGFSDIYYFSRAFKKHKKAAPSSLRNSAK